MPSTSPTTSYARPTGSTSALTGIGPRADDLAGLAIGLYFVLWAIVAAAEIPVVVLIGDSTVTTDKGWGAAFAAMLDGRADVHNFAVGGRSAKSYTDENRLAGALAVRPDYVFIQFGHNGQPGKGDYRETDPKGSYRDYLRRFVADIRAAGAEPIIVSSLTRRHFGPDGRIESTLGPWAEGARAVATESHVPFIDLHAASIELHNQLGESRSAEFDYESGDRTHLNEAGARTIAGLIFDALEDIDHPLAALRPAPAEADDGSAGRAR